MKKILFVLITLITVSNFSHASFPIIENDTKIPKTIISEDDEEEEPSLLEAILMGVLVVSILGFVSYFLLRTIWRACKKRKWWARKLLPLLLLISLPTFLIGFIGPLISIILLIILGIIMLIRKLMGKTIVW
jgi:hypothetical protein